MAWGTVKIESYHSGFKAFLSLALFFYLILEPLD